MGRAGITTITGMTTATTIIIRAIRTRITRSGPSRRWRR
jgi:hypothetical protein